MQRRSSQRPHRGTSIVIACLITATVLVGGIFGAVALTGGQGGTPPAGEASASASPASSDAVSPSPSASRSNQAERALDALQPVVSAAGFVHPGVFVNLAELKATRDHINAGDQPWTDLFHVHPARRPGLLGLRTRNRPARGGTGVQREQPSGLRVVLRLV